MPRTKQECERIRNETKEKIFWSATSVFAKKGYAATSTTDIANAAGISIGLLYRYFKSKQELFESILAFAVGGLVEVAKVLHSDGNPKEIIDAMLYEMLSELENEDFININMMVTQGLISEDNSVFETIIEHDKKMFEAAAKLIKRGQDEGIFCDGDPKTKSALLFSSIQGVAMMKFLFKESFKMPSLKELTAFLY